MRMAELHQARRRRTHRRGSRSQPRNGPHRGDVREVRRASWPRLRRRPRAHGPSLLHQLGSAKARAEKIAALLRPRWSALCEEKFEQRASSVLFGDANSKVYGDDAASTLPSLTAVATAA